jgi:hypothetical protein
VRSSQTRDNIVTKQKEDEEDRRVWLESLLNQRSPPRIPPTSGGGITPLDVLELTPDLRQIANLIVREGSSTAGDLALSTQMDLDIVLELLDTLEAQGHIRRIRGNRVDTFEPTLGRTRRPRLSSGLWKLLEDR